MKGRSITAKDKEWLDKITEFGCIVCHVHLGVFTPAEPHHIFGKTRPGAHLHTIPMCPEHHRHGTVGPARHKNKTEFEAAFGTEQHLYQLLLEAIT